MDPIGLAGWDSEIGRNCERALAGPDLDGPLRARVLARHAQVLVYRGEYGCADEVSRDALDAAELIGDPNAMVDALRARQLARSGPDGSGERAVIAARMRGWQRLGRDVGQALADRHAVRDRAAAGRLPGTGRPY